MKAVFLILCGLIYSESSFAFGGPRVQDLESENAELTQQLADCTASQEQSANQISQLQREVARLNMEVNSCGESEHIALLNEQILELEAQVDGLNNELQICEQENVAQAIEARMLRTNIAGLTTQLQICETETPVDCSAVPSPFVSVSDPAYALLENPVRDSSGLVWSRPKLTQGGYPASVSWSEATAYCAARGARLPTPNELMVLIEDLADACGQGFILEDTARRQQVPFSGARWVWSNVPTSMLNVTLGRNIELEAASAGIKYSVMCVKSSTP